MKIVGKITPIDKEEADTILDLVHKRAVDMGCSRLEVLAALTAYDVVDYVPPEDREQKDKKKGVLELTVEFDAFRVVVDGESEIGRLYQTYQGVGKRKNYNALRDAIMDYLFDNTAFDDVSGSDIKDISGKWVGEVED